MFEIITIKKHQLPVMSEGYLILEDYEGEVATLGCYGCKNLLELTVSTYYKGGFIVKCNWCGNIVAKS